MGIEKIIYDTTREIHGVEHKMSIATIFLFCKKQGSKKLSELLYSENPMQFIDEMNTEYESSGIDFSIDFKNPNIKSAFFKTLEKVKEKWDSNGFLEAISKGDEFAVKITEIINTTNKLYK